MDQDPFRNPDQYISDSERVDAILAAAQEQSTERITHYGDTTTASAEFTRLQQEGGSPDELAAALDALRATVQGIKPQNPEI